MLQTHLQHLKANVCIICVTEYVYMQDNYVYMYT